MKNVFLKPREIDGQPALIRDPQSQKPLAAGGEWKPQDHFWTRRLAQGDVVDATEEQGKAPAAAAPPPAPEPESTFEPGPSLKPAKK